MANWKKVLVSGSNIEVNHITASAGVQLQSLLSNTENLSVLTVDGSGNVMVRPHAYFSYNDPYGDLRTSGNHKNIQLNDLGSGSLYRMVILGDLQ